MLCQRGASDPQAYVVSQLKRRQVEIHENHLSPEKLKEFQAAKETEVRNFLFSGCFEAVQGRVRQRS